MYAGPLHGSTPTHFSSITMPPLSQYYRMTAGTFGNLPSLVPSCSSHPGLHNDSAGSIGLSDLHLEGTLFGASNPPTPVHPPALALQPRDRDDYGRCYLIHYGTGFRTDAGVGIIARNCICRHFNVYWTSWQKVPEMDRERKFNEFHKYYRWDDANECAIKRIFHRRARSRFNGQLDYARSNVVRPDWIRESLWQYYIHYWNRKEYQLLRVKGKKARASSKGCSLHTAGAVSMIDVEEKMEKKRVERYHMMSYSRRRI